MYAVQYLETREVPSCRCDKITKTRITTYCTINQISINLD